MEFMKFSILTLILSTNILASGFSANECLNQNFTTETSGKGSLFGLLKHGLVIEKSDCVIKAKEKKYFVMETIWQVDICREPIHLKRTQLKNTSVYKKEKKCKGNAGDEFCKKTQAVLDLLRDVGLIFAEGNRQSLESDHGKTYCTYLLLKEYLEKDSVFVSGQSEVYIDGIESSTPRYIEPIVLENKPVEEIMDIPSAENEVEASEDATGSF